MARNRIIYQSQAVFISPSSTGVHLQTGSTDTAASTTWANVTGFDGTAGAGDTYRSLTQPLTRIQSANFNFSINRQDVNEFGSLARLDSLVMESPTVGLDFNYYLTDGGNERKLGFNIPTTAASRASNTAYYDADDLAVSGYSALSGLLGDTQGNNYFIVVAKEGQDVQGDTVSTTAGNFDAVAIGNGFITDYSIEAAVGAIPTASVTVEAFNITDDLISGAKMGQASPAPVIPSIDENGQYKDGSSVNQSSYQYLFTEEADTNIINVSGAGADRVTALRPGDIEFTIGNGDVYEGLVDLDGDGTAHIQSFSVSVPMSRTILQRLGTTFGYARVLDLPINATVSVSAIVSEYGKKVLANALCHSKEYSFTLKLRL